MFAIDCAEILLKWFGCSMPVLSKIKLSHYSMQASRGRGDIAPTHSQPRHWIGVKWSASRLYPLDRRLGGPQGWSGHRG
jgi:hypothetical protein